MTQPTALSGTNLPPDLAQRLQSELQRGELLFWNGQPDPALLARRGLIFTVFGILFLTVPLLILSVFLLLAFLSHSFLFLCFTPFLLIFILIGGFIVLMPHWNRLAARKSLYAITDRRAIVWQKSIFALNVRSFMPDQLANMTRRELGNGSGDLIFYQSTYRDIDGTRQNTAVGFFALPDVHQVEDLLRATLLPPKTL